MLCYTVENLCALLNGGGIQYLHTCKLRYLNYYSILLPHALRSGKKEALANVGGLLCCNDDTLYESLRNLTIVVEGYPTYGGLACR